MNSNCYGKIHMYLFFFLNISLFSGILFWMIMFNKLGCFQVFWILYLLTIKFKTQFHIYFTKNKNLLNIYRFYIAKIQYTFNALCEILNLAQIIMRVFNFFIKQTQEKPKWPILVNLGAWQLTSFSSLPRKWDLFSSQKRPKMRTARWQNAYHISHRKRESNWEK